MRNGLILNSVVMGLGMHPGAWRYRDGDPFAYTDIGYYQEIARLSEVGRLHAIFLADTLAVSEENFERPNLGAMDPTIVLAALAGETRHVGLVATTSTTYNEPYNIARRFASLDHLSRGRAAWNISTFVPDVAANFADTALLPHDDRYERATESVDIVRRLWASWEQEALVGDKAAGVFANGARASINHSGEHYSVRGPLTLRVRPRVGPSCSRRARQPGRELAARSPTWCSRHRTRSQPRWNFAPTYAAGWRPMAAIPTASRSSRDCCRCWAARNGRRGRARTNWTN
jgi:alkanesulfonate monooxygenase SsuD/methylene tetrahydromethanopterin reductase-like flavin-dependent oxidoreductase (luciferase family)